MGMILEKLISSFGAEEKTMGANDNNNCSSDEVGDVPDVGDNITNGKPGSFSQSSWSQCITAQQEINLIEVGRRQSQSSEVIHNEEYYTSFDEDYCLQSLFDENESDQEDDAIAEGSRRVHFSDDCTDTGEDSAWQVHHHFYI
jgi:hypothetical protein